MNASNSNHLFDISTQNKYSTNHPDWIEGESIRSYMTTQLQTVYVTLLAIPILFFILHRHADFFELSIWSGISMLINSYRLWVTRRYINNFSDKETESQLFFQKKQILLLPLVFAVWGALVFVFYAKTPLLNQFICWISLACIGMFATIGYASHLRTFKLVINTLMLASIASMAYNDWTAAAAATTSMTLMLLPLILLLWMLFILLGMRLNKAHTQKQIRLKGHFDLINTLKEQTFRANKAVETKNRFLASAAHDIRQPVLALDVYASMLRAEPSMAGVLTEKIELATKSVIEMFDSLFDLSRLDAGQLKVSNSDIDVLTLMLELELQYKPAAHNKHLKLRMRSGRFKTHTDPQLLKRILGNLLMNAIKFTNNGGVLLACRRTLKGIRFEVWDTGVGIAADEQAAVFGEFYKSSSYLGTSEGFGLGLSIVSRLCEPLGFKFSMQSRLGRGSVFVVEVPTVARQQLAA
jgi:signal transduction histidine kinase